MAHWWSYGVIHSTSFSECGSCVSSPWSRLTCFVRAVLGYIWGSTAPAVVKALFFLRVVGPAEVLPPGSVTSSTTNGLLGCSCSREVVYIAQFNGLRFPVLFLSKYHELLLTTHPLPIEILADVGLCQGMFHAACNGSSPRRPLCRLPPPRPSATQ